MLINVKAYWKYFFSIVTDQVGKEGSIASVIHKATDGHGFLNCLKSSLAILSTLAIEDALKWITEENKYGKNQTLTNFQDQISERYLLGNAKE